MKKNDGFYSRLPDDIPPGDAEQALELLAEFNQEKELAMAEITRKYDFYEKLFAAVFAERKAVADGFFRVIDQGIREKNNDLVLAGLSSLSGMVASSPLTKLGSFR